MYDLKLPCDARPECYHRVCHVCSKPLRNGQLKADHPGTVAGHIANRLCDRHMIEGHKPVVPPTPKPKPKFDPLAQDYRHVLLSDDELSNMAEHSPHMHAWTMRRRQKLGLAQLSDLDKRRRAGKLPFGVYKAGQKWKAQFKINGRTTYFGVYSTIEEAAQVAAQELNRREARQ